MKFLNYLAIAAIALCTVSCDDDDDPVKEEEKQEVVSPAESVKGDYEGSFDLMGEKVALTVDAQAQKDGKLTLVVPEFQVKAMGSVITMPSIKLDDVTIEKAEGKENEFTLTKDPFTIVAGEMSLANKKGLQGSIKGESMELNFDITPGAMPIPINFAFVGAKKK